MLDESLKTTPLEQTPPSESGDFPSLFHQLVDLGMGKIIGAPVSRIASPPSHNDTLGRIEVVSGKRQVPESVFFQPIFIILPVDKSGMNHVIIDERGGIVEVIANASQHGLDNYNDSFGLLSGDYIQNSIFNIRGVSRLSVFLNMNKGPLGIRTINTGLETDQDMQSLIDAFNKSIQTAKELQVERQKRANHIKEQTTSVTRNFLKEPSA